MWDLDTLARLNHGGGLRLAFLTLVLKRQALEARYPGGLGAFLGRSPGARAEGPLVAVHAMSGGDLGEVADHLAGAGYDMVSDSAVGDMFAGPLEACPGIGFYRTRLGQWYAVAKQGGTA